MVPGRMRWLAMLCSNSSAKLSVMFSLTIPWHFRCARGVTIKKRPSFHDNRDLFHSGSARQTPAGHFQDMLDHRIDGDTRGIQQHRVCAWDQGRNRAVHIAPITLRYLQRKGGKGSSNPLFFQLLMAPGGPLFGARREKNLNLRLREYHGSHVAAVRHQTRGYGKAPLALQERRAHRG